MKRLPVFLDTSCKRQHATPPIIASRLHWINEIASDLSGSYDAGGIRRWFKRERSQLDGRSPRELLGGQWCPDDALALRIRPLAASLRAGGFT